MAIKISSNLGHLERLLVEESNMLAEISTSICNIMDPSMNNIVNHIDHGMVVKHGHEYFYLAQEYIPGKTVEALLKDGPLDVPRALEIFHQVCFGLNFLHSQKIAHADIKPSNIIVADDGLVKILDFGMARKFPSVTKGGTMRYRSPEQAALEQIDQRSDIYSLGITFWRMLMGRLPHQKTPDEEETLAVEGKTDPNAYRIKEQKRKNRELTEKIEKEPIPPLPDHFPEPLRKTVAKMTEKDRDLRYPDVPALLEDLGGLQK